ncbi:hypothetical protein Rsub_08587 [Raphidocelis subcapitata]|uniref:Uncharacterized protein n=1 Tax=Raphidocelis subcapitata TaxID=307507 RepID=A0A2V0PET3_9CHLO|nr:hypothetical protein Rsub_08587 [Raphidocelis subcapitata]|eukprot:GBF95605.1 hypothetical protein Rsub_08587 [Raphidocelis subcapitata]
MKALAGARSGTGASAAPPAAAPRRPAAATSRRRLDASGPPRMRGGGRGAVGGGLGGGWGVEVPGEPAQQQGGRAPQQRPTPEPGQAAAPQPSAAGAAPAPQPRSDSGKRRAKRASTPFVSMQTPEGQLGLAMLQQSLAAEEQKKQQQQQKAKGKQGRAVASGDAPTIAELKATLAGTGPGGKRGSPAAAAAMAAALPLRQRAPAADDGEGIDEQDELGGVPSFQLTFSAAGTELFDLDAKGRPVVRRGGDEADGGQDAAALDDAGADDGSGADDSFGANGWDQFAFADGAEEGGGDDGGDVKPSESDDMALLRDLAGEDDWGLDALDDGGAHGAGSSRRRPSLLSQATREAREREEAAGSTPGGDAMAWGGSGGATGIDLEEQEEVLSRFFRPHEVQRFMAVQREIDANAAAMRARTAGVGASERRLHRQLKVIAGSAAGRRLVSSRGAQTRPMMEKVRAAVFDMVQSQAGSVGGLPQGSRWLDLFAGTGSVGLEALSRGAGEAHFVELDPWVHRRVLAVNIDACGFAKAATRHTARAEDFLRRAAVAPRFAGGAFDFVSVCPPYLLVSYPELYDLLGASGLLHERSVAFVEYPKQLAHHIRPTLGPLARVRDRCYGRTYIAIYARDGAGDGASGDEGGDGAGGGAVGAEWGL